MIFWYNKTSFENLSPYLYLALQGMGLLCAETSVYDILNIVAGLLSVEEAAAQIITCQIGYMVYMLPVGFSYSGSAFIGNYVGENQVKMAKMFSKFIIFYAWLIMVMVSCTMYIQRDFVSAFFSKDPLVINEIQRIMPYLAVFIVVDCVHAAQLGVIKGLGL